MTGTALPEGHGLVLRRARLYATLDSLAAFDAWAVAEDPANLLTAI